MLPAGGGVGDGGGDVHYMLQSCLELLCHAALAAHFAVRHGIIATSVWS